MKESTRKSPTGLPTEAHITMRQLDVFRRVYHERSYAHAALDLRSTRTNVKRLCDDFEKAVGRPLFGTDGEKNLVPTDFANGLISHMGPLSHAMRRLSDSVRSLHERGRVVRFGAAGEFFRGGLFTQYLARLRINDAFRPCFLRIDTPRFRTSLLNAECDVYFGVGLVENDRLESIDLGPVPWKIKVIGKGKGRQKPSLVDLGASNWWIRASGESDSGPSMLEAFRAAGAKGGEMIDPPDALPTGNGYLFEADTSAHVIPAEQADWPCYRFSAVLRKHHPYSELKSRLEGAAFI